MYKRQSLRLATHGPTNTIFASGYFSLAIRAASVSYTHLDVYKRQMLNTVEEGLEDIRQGKVLIVVDDEDRENEGDFIDQYLFPFFLRVHFYIVYSQIISGD